MTKGEARKEIYKVIHNIIGREMTQAEHDAVKKMVVIHTNEQARIADLGWKKQYEELKKSYDELLVATYLKHGQAKRARRLISTQKD